MAHLRCGCLGMRAGAETLKAPVRLKAPGLGLCGAEEGAELRELVMDREARRAAVHWVTKSQTQRRELN